MIAVELEGYRIVRPLGEGGMGTVLLAEELALERLVAIKVIREELGDARMIARFRAEARALARLTHPNVVQVFHVGEVQGRPYIVYEHVPGLSLDRLGAPRPWTEVLDIGVGLARGLAAVHRVSLLHRDIKPANVMLSEQGVPKLIDFGLARPSDGAEGGSIEGMLAGTPEYMAPELLAGGRATMRSDVFALGLILRELLTGEHLRRGLSLGQLMGVASRESIPPAAVGDAPAGLVDLLARCLRRDPAERCASAAELRDGLELLRDYHRVFSARGDTRGAHPSFDRVTASFARMGSAHDALIATFYERLFSRAPQLRALFPAELEPQRAKLLEALRATIGALEAPERVAPMLVALGRRHARYGVVSAHLAIAGDALLDAVRAHDPQADDEVISAWRAAWELVSDAFARGLHDASTPPPSDRATSDTVARTMVASAGAVVAVGGSTPVAVTRFADVGGATIAWQVEGTGAYGTGACDVVLVPGFVSHLEVGLSWPPLASLRRGLADEARLVMLDLLGNGLSERVSELPSIGEWAEGVLGVLDEAGSERAILLGHAEGAAAALAAAVLRPDRVAGLVLLGAPAGVRPEEPLPDAARIRREWGGPVLARELAPSAASDARFAELWSTLLRMGSSPALVAAMIARFPEIDACALAPWVQQKVIVVQRRGDRRAPLSGAERLHRALGERSRLLVTEGADHALFVGDSAPLIAACRELREEPPSTPARGPITIALAVRGDADEAAVRRALAAPGTVMRATSVTEALARAERAVAKAGQRGLSLAAGIGVGASLEDAGAQAVAVLGRVERGVALDEVASCLASPRRGGDEPDAD